MDGHEVMTMEEAAAVGELFITATGNRDIIRREHFESMQDGAQLANAGHFDVEIALEDLEAMTEETTTPRRGVTTHHLDDGRRLHLLTNGRLVNLTGPYSEGHPAEIIDMTDALMFLAGFDFLVRDPEVEPGAHPLPDRLDREIAEMKLDSLDIAIDDMTDEQVAYARDWRQTGSSY